MVVLVFGVGTDYTIFLISRFREEVSKGDWHAASRTTVRRIGAVITASAATVIVGLGSMAFGEFGMIQTTGPALAIAIFVTLVAGLTLTPALLGIFGHYLFWPRHERDESDGRRRAASSPAWRPPSRADRPSSPASSSSRSLVPMHGDPGDAHELRRDLRPADDSDARVGFDLVADPPRQGQDHAGQRGDRDRPRTPTCSSPASLGQVRDATQAVAGTAGVQSVTSLISPTGDGSVPDGFVPSRQLEAMADGFAQSGGEREGSPRS